MNQAEYRLAIQSSGRGLFAKIVLFATLTNDQNGLTIIYETTEGKEWKSAIDFGIYYAYEQIFHKLHNKNRYRGLIVKIDEIVGTVVDTKEIAMVYVSAMAVWKALDVYPKFLPIFDDENRTFTFPE